MALTAAQLQTLKADLAANTATVVVAGNTVAINSLDTLAERNTDSADAVAQWYNGTASPSFTVWKKLATLNQIGDAINATELAGLTSLNISRLEAIATYSPAGVNPSLADRRQAFDDIFSGAGGTNTRASLLALWKRLANRAEKLFATGTGSDASPATLSFEGALTFQNVLDAWTS